jgi:putative endonuclease
MFHTYILQSEKDNSFYIGHTEDIVTRLANHNEGLSIYTSNKRPWKLVYAESFATRKEAMKREYFLKKQRNRQFYEKLIASYKKI